MEEGEGEEDAHAYARRVGEGDSLDCAHPYAVRIGGACDICAELAQEVLLRRRVPMTARVAGRELEVGAEKGFE